MDNVARVNGALVSSRDKVKGNKSLREVQNNKIDGSVRTLTASSIESRATRTKPRKGAEVAQVELLDAGWLGGAYGSSKSKAGGSREEERERKRNHTKGNENAAEGACLSKRPSLAFISERVLCKLQRK